MEATPIGYNDLHTGDRVMILSQDTYFRKVGTVDYITDDRQWYQVRLIGRYGSDVTPFHRPELMKVRAWQD